MADLAKVVKKLAVQPRVFIKFPKLDFDITSAQNVVVLPGEEIWAIKKEGIKVIFDNQTTCEIDGKKVGPNNINCVWKMERERAPDKWMGYEDSNKFNPDAELYVEGKYKITLTVSHPKIKEDFDKIKELTVKQFKGPKIAGDLGAQKPIAGKEVVIKFDKYPDGIAGIKGSTFIIKHGDGEMTKGNEVPEKVRITYTEAKDYQTIIILSLPGGESIEIPGPAIAVKNPMGEIIVSKNDPWIGEKVKFQSLYPIPAGVKAVYTWDLGDGMVIKGGKKVEGHYQTSGKKNVKLTIEIAGLQAKVVAMFPPGEELVVKGIDVQIGVGGP
jgi:hypothetical protein